MTMYIKVVSAVLTRDVDLFNNMDPYCIIKIGSQKKITRTINQGGKKPTWDQILIFKNLNANQIEITVMDKDKFSDDVIGSGTLPLNKFKNTSEEFKQYVGLTYKGKPAGKIFLCLKFGSEGSSWGNHIQSNWSNQNSSGWGNQNNNNGWGNQNNNNNNGWGDQQNNNNNNGWGNSNNNNNNPPIPPQQYQGNFINAMENMANKNNNNSEWSNQNNNNGW